MFPRKKHETTSPCVSGVTRVRRGEPAEGSYRTMKEPKATASKEPSGDQDECDGNSSRNFVCDPRVQVASQGISYTSINKECHIQSTASVLFTFVLRNRQTFTVPSLPVVASILGEVLLSSGEKVMLVIPDSP